MSFQATFGEPVAGCVGEIYDYDSHDKGDICSKTAAVVIPFGRAVFTAAATPNVCALPTSEAEAARIRGVSVSDRTQASGGTGYAVANQVKILERGRIRAFFETAMADLQSVYVRVTESATGAGDLGQFRGDSAAGAAVVVTNARFLAVDGVLGASGIGVLECNFVPGVGLIGPTGPTGATGATGPTGPTGPTGATG